MPSTRTGRQYSARPSMPSSPTLRQGSHASSPFSTMSTSILTGLSPYRWQEQIPDITLSKYGRIINDNNDYDDLMAILYPQTNLYSKIITMRHLWTTAQKLRREAGRQEIKARRLFMEMEGLGLQQILHPHQNTLPWESFSSAAQPPTLYYPAQSQETKFPTPPLMSPSLGAPGNPIVTNPSFPLTCVQPVFVHPFLFMIRHAFTSRQTCLLPTFILFLPCVLHVFTSRQTHSFTYLNQ